MNECDDRRSTLALRRTDDATTRRRDDATTCDTKDEGVARTASAFVLHARTRRPSPFTALTANLGF